MRLGLNFPFVVYVPGVSDVDIEQIDPKKTDPEYLEFQCLNVEEVEKLLNESVEHLSNTIHLTPSLAKVLLLEHDWQANEIVEKYNRNPSGLLVSHLRDFGFSIITAPIVLLELQIRSRIKPQSAPAKKPQPNECSSSSSQHSSFQQACTVCASSNHSSQHYYSLSCGHSFCKECWAMHFETQINQGTTVSTVFYILTIDDGNLSVSQESQRQSDAWHPNVTFVFRKNWC